LSTQTVGFGLLVVVVVVVLFVVVVVLFVVVVVVGFTDDFVVLEVVISPLSIIPHHSISFVSKFF